MAYSEEIQYAMTATIMSFVV